MKQYPQISVVFPVLNSEKLLPDFFNSLKQQTYPQTKIEVIIVDNASSDETVKEIKNQYPQASIIRLKKNIGFAPALNIAAKQAEAEIIFVTNDDVTFNKNCIEELVNLLNSDSKIGMVSGKLLFQKPKGVSAWPGFKLNPWLGYQPYDSSKQNRVRESDWFSGPAMMLKTSTLKKAGFFDEGYFFAGEDYDLSLTFKKLGFKILYTPKALIYHGFRRTGKAKGTNYSSIYNHFRGRFRVVIKHASLPQIFTYFPIQLFLVPIYRLFTTGPQNTAALLKAQTSALLWNFHHLPQTLKARKEIQKLITNNQIPNQ